MKLWLNALIKYLMGLVLVGLLVFLPAGTLCFPHGWLFLAIPLVLGSLWAVLCFLPYLPLIVTHILDEEKLLTAELAGYTEYKNKVKCRLIPFIW